MKTILQVEDDPNDVFFLRKAMKKMGVMNPVQVATDGQQAIDYLQGAGPFADRGRFPYPSLVLLSAGRLWRSSCCRRPHKRRTS
jgi:two-component system response regulator